MMEKIGSELSQGHDDSLVEVGAGWIETLLYPWDPPRGLTDSVPVPDPTLINHVGFRW